MSTSAEQQLTIPAELKPADGRFGCGPSKVRPEALARLGEGTAPMGTSHRQKPVKALVGEIRAGLSELFGAPDGYEVALGNGGATAFWDAAACGLIERRSLHLTYGEFSSKFAQVAREAPFLEEPVVIKAEPGDAPDPAQAGAAAEEAGADVVAWAHNETSTGVMVPVVRPGRAQTRPLVLIDATSGAGGLPVDVAQADAYYFAPQKSFAADGGLWVALLSPAAQERIAKLAGSTAIGPPPGSRSSSRSLRRWKTRSKTRPTTRPRWRRCFCSPSRSAGCSTAVALTGACRALGILRAPLRLGRAHLLHDAVRRRSREALAGRRHDRLRRRVDAAAVAKTLRANGILDTEPYRKLGRNQLRIGMFPAVEPADVQALTACIEWVVERSAS